MSASNVNPNSVNPDDPALIAEHEQTEEHQNLQHMLSEIESDLSTGAYNWFLTVPSNPHDEPSPELRHARNLVEESHKHPRSPAFPQDEVVEQVEALHRQDVSKSPTPERSSSTEREQSPLEGENNPRGKNTYQPELPIYVQHDEKYEAHSDITYEQRKDLRWICLRCVAKYGREHGRPAEIWMLDPNPPSPSNEETLVCAYGCGSEYDVKTGKGRDASLGNRPVITGVAIAHDGANPTEEYLESFRWICRACVGTQIENPNTHGLAYLVTINRATSVTCTGCRRFKEFVGQKYWSWKDLCQFRVI